MKTLYIDEAGVYADTIEKLDPNSPIFLICGVVISKKEENKLRKKFNKLKLKYFGRTNLVFHSLEFTHPNKSKQVGINQFASVEFRAKFYPELTKIIAQIDFKIGAFATHIEKYLITLKENQSDPYLIGISLILDTLVNNLISNEQAKIIAESRANSKLNKAVTEIWINEYKNYGRVSLVTKEKLDAHNIQKPSFHDKDPAMCGLELVDLVAYQLSRGLIKKPQKGIENEIPLEVINMKIDKISWL